MVIAGPNTDYAEDWGENIVSAPACGTPAVAPCIEPDGTNFRFHAATPIPAAAAGSYTLGMEGRVVALDPNLGVDQTFYALNPTMAFAVTDASAVPRRTIVQRDRCNSCHQHLDFHGGNRGSPEYCVMCHSPNNSNDERASRFEGSTVAANTVHFAPMIHSIHMGEQLTQKPYLLYGYPPPNVGNPGGNPVDFSETRYPREPNDCAVCHEPGTFTLPIAAGALPSRSEVLSCTEAPGADVDDFCSTRSSVEQFVSPEASACTGCHDAAAVKAHAELNTTSGGVEACATCHGSGSAQDVELVHALAP